jgi:hypothetical protein
MFRETIFATLLKIMFDLLIFTSIPVALQYKSNISLYFSASLRVPIPNKITSFRNNKWVKCKDLPIFIPLIALSFLHYFTALLRPSVTRRKRKGDIGHSCLESLS